MSIKLSNRSDIESFRVLDNLRAANELVMKGENIMRLEAGQPCFGAPEAALKHAQQVIADDPRQGYTEAVGMPLLRDRIAVNYRDRYGCDLDYSRIAITVGSSGALIFTFLAAFDAGDRVAVTVPCYPAYRNILKSVGLEVVEIETTAETGYQPTAEILEKCGQKFDGLIINSPANPTGAMIPEDELQRICQWCEQNGVRLVSDEAYHHITYEIPAQTVVKYSKTAIATNTFSKYYAMTGWRLGWMVMPEDMVDRVKRLAENLFVSPPTIAQHLAYKVFDHTDVLDGYVKQYKKNRDILREHLPSSGIENLSRAEGAFYFYADIRNLTNDSNAFCRRMLEEAQVSATSGIDFDSERGHTTMRISYAGSAEDMLEACRRLKVWLG